VVGVATTVSADGSLSGVTVPHAAKSAMANSHGIPDPDRSLDLRPSIGSSRHLRQRRSAACARSMQRLNASTMVNMAMAPASEEAKAPTYARILKIP
jgi:hypothetical protein